MMIIVHYSFKIWRKGTAYDRINILKQLFFLNVARIGFQYMAAIVAGAQLL